MERAAAAAAEMKGAGDDDGLDRGLEDVALVT